MSNNIITIIKMINSRISHNDFAGARNLIEEHFKKVTETKYYMQLHEDAQVLTKHIMSEMNNEDEVQFSRSELLIINSINHYSTNFDISMLKRIVRDSAELLNKPKIVSLLNKDAKYLLENMGVLFSAPQLQKVNS